MKKKIIFNSLSKMILLHIKKLFCKAKTNQMLKKNKKIKNKKLISYNVELALNKKGNKNLIQ